MSDEITIEYEPILPVENVTFNFTIPVGDLFIYEGQYADNNKHTYKPQENITNYELALLLKLFVFAATTHTGFHSYDYWSYVKDNNLERHFT